METPSQNTKLKLFLGFGSLLVVLLFSLILVYRNVRVLTVIDEEIVLNTDSVSNLVHEKDLKAKELIDALSLLNSELIVSTSNIEKLLVKKDPVPLVKKQVEIKQDTILTKPKKKKFFKRLGEAFVPSKADSVVQVSTSRVVAIDTVYSSGVSGIDPSNEELITRVNKKINTENKNRKQSYNKAKQLESLSMEISTQIDSILNEYTNARFDQFFEKLKSNNERRQTAVSWITVIATLGVFLTFVFVILLIRDINKRNKYRIALEKANIRANDLLQAREKLMLTITHDIKAPIGTIMGYAELLHQTNLSKEQISYLESIDKSSEHAYKLIYDLLDYHSLDLNKANINKTSFNAYDLFAEIEQSFKPQYSTKGLKLVGAFEKEKLDQFIESDRVRLVQVVNNLLSNALKFTAKGQVELRADLKEETLFFSVIDTGAGMSDAEREKVFKEFTRLPNAQGQEGFGLGLSIVKKILDHLDGTITVESEKNVGTAFHISIPVALKSSGGSVVKPNDQIKFSEDTRILLLDDDTIQLKLTSIMLENHGAEVVACNHVEDLFDELKRSEFNLLVTDIQMPEMDGFKLLELLRASNITAYKEIPVLAVSAHSSIDEKEFKNRGFIGVLKKPFQASDVYNALNGEITQQSECVETVVGEEVNLDLNLTGLHEFLGDDAEAIQSVLQAFVEDANVQLEELKGALDENNYVKISSIAHKIYPTIKLLGEERLVALLTEIQTKVKSGQAEDLNSDSKLIIDLLSELTQKITRFIEA